MKPIQFGNAFPIHYQRLKGPGRGDQLLSRCEDKRENQEDRMQITLAERLCLMANGYGRDTQWVFTDRGEYLLTDGPKADTLTLYRGLQNQGASPKSLLEKIEKTDRVIDAMDFVNALDDGSPALNVQYWVSPDKDFPDGFKPQIANHAALRAIFENTLKPC